MADLKWLPQDIAVQIGSYLHANDLFSWEAVYGVALHKKSPFVWNVASRGQVIHDAYPIIYEPIFLQTLQKVKSFTAILKVALKGQEDSKVLEIFQSDVFQAYLASPQKLLPSDRTWTLLIHAARNRRWSLFSQWLQVLVWAPGVVCGGHLQAIPLLPAVNRDTLACVLVNAPNEILLQAEFATISQIGSLSLLHPLLKTNSQENDIIVYKALKKNGTPYALDKVCRSLEVIYGGTSGQAVNPKLERRLRRFVSSYSLDDRLLVLDSIHARHSGRHYRSNPVARVLWGISFGFLNREDLEKRRNLVVRGTWQVSNIKCKMGSTSTLGAR